MSILMKIVSIKINLDLTIFEFSMTQKLLEKRLVPDRTDQFFLLTKKIHNDSLKIYKNINP